MHTSCAYVVRRKPLTRARAGRTVLEIGSYLGFSAAVLSHAVGAGGIVTGLEASSEYAELARSKLAGLGIENVEFKVGPASDT